MDARNPQQPLRHAPGRLAVVVALAVAAAFFAGSIAGSLQGSTSARGRQARLLDAVRSIVQRDSAYPVSAAALRAGSVKALLRRLGDPYAAYLGPAAWASEERSLNGAYDGVGVRVDGTARGFVVTDVAPDSPAAAAGVRRGDVITRIDGARAASLDVAELTDRLAGPSGSSVRIELQTGRGSDSVRVVRAPVSAQSVTITPLRIGGRHADVIRIRRFSQGSAAALRSAVDLAAHDLSIGVIVDLRGTPGGLLGEAASAAGVFLDGRPIATVDGAAVPSQRFVTARGSAYLLLPVVVLVDRGTASSAEIFAAALQEQHRATIVGTRTYGKASVQELVALPGGGALKLTVAHYRTGLGRDLNGRGVRPDVRAPYAQLAVGARILGRLVP